MEEVEVSPESTEQTQSLESTEVSDTPIQESKEPEFVDIDQPDKYRYQGRPLKEWESGFMRQGDYSRKTQELAQERKYYDNLSADLDKVRNQPELAEQFRKIYPEKFHSYLRYVERENSAPKEERTNYAKLDPSYESRIQRIEESIRGKEIETINSELDRKFEGLSKKFPYADEEAVIARAQALLDRMKQNDPMNENLRISDKQWEALWKSQHDRAFGLASSKYNENVKAQLKAHKAGSSSGPGGAIAGQAPRQFKTLKEATEAAMADIQAGVI